MSRGFGSSSGIRLISACGSSVSSSPVKPKSCKDCIFSCCLRLIIACSYAFCLSAIIPSSAGRGMSALNPPTLSTFTSALSAGANIRYMHPAKARNISGKTIIFLRCCTCCGVSSFLGFLSFSGLMSACGMVVPFSFFCASSIFRSV